MCTCVNIYGFYGIFLFLFLDILLLPFSLSNSHLCLSLFICHFLPLFISLFHSLSLYISISNYGSITHFSFLYSSVSFFPVYALKFLFLFLSSHHLSLFSHLRGLTLCSALSFLDDLFSNGFANRCSLGSSSVLLIFSRIFYKKRNKI